MSQGACERCQKMPCECDGCSVCLRHHCECDDEDPAHYDAEGVCQRCHSMPCECQPAQSGQGNGKGFLNELFDICVFLSIFAGCFFCLAVAVILLYAIVKTLF